MMRLPVVVIALMAGCAAAAAQSRVSYFPVTRNDRLVLIRY